MNLFELRSINFELWEMILSFKTLDDLLFLLPSVLSDMLRYRYRLAYKAQAVFLGYELGLSGIDPDSDTI